MGTAVCYAHLGPVKVYHRIRNIDASSNSNTSSSDTTNLRRKGLNKLDQELAKGDGRAALSVIRDLQGKPGGLRCFGAAKQVPRRLYTLDELKLNGIQLSSVLSPVVATLGSIERNLQVAALLGGIAAWKAFGLDAPQLLYISLGLLFLRSLDAIAYDGGIARLLLHTIARFISWKYNNRVVQHEAGHFLIAYLVGVLPREYTLSSLDALKQEGSLNAAAGISFVDYEFVNSGKVSATTMLNRFSCIAVAGVATEYLLYGYAEGGLSDINQLDRLLGGSGFMRKKADSQVRWAVLNTILLLRRHEEARAKLADAMSKARSVGDCIDVIEEAIKDTDI